MPFVERPRFSGCGAVIHTHAGVLRYSGRVMFVVGHTGSGKQGSRDEVMSIGELKALAPGLYRNSGHFERREKLSAKPLRLRQRAACQFAAADVDGKAEIVLNPRTGACLPAGRVSVEQQSPQSFRCAVHRCGETGRSGADDYQVIDVEGSRERAAKALRYLARLRVTQHRNAVIEK